MRREESITRELKILANMLNRRAEAMIPCELRQEVTEMQGRIIGFLFHSGDRPICQRDVEAEFSITRATASKTLTLMERNGLIIRSSVAGDARLKRLELTDKAVLHMRHIHRGLLQFEALATRGLTEEERTTLLSLLRRIERNLEE